MKIKIIEPGWLNYTGHFGMIPFEDGVSVEDVGTGDQRFLASLVAIETVEDKPRNPSITQLLLDTQATTMSPEPVQALQSVEAPLDATTSFTKDGLEKIADEEGIKGLRAIGDPLGLKDNSIAALIAKILTDQDAKRAAADALATMAEAEAKAAVHPAGVPTP